VRFCESLQQPACLTSVANVQQTSGLGHMLSWPPTMPFFSTPVPMTAASAAAGSSSAYPHTPKLGTKGVSYILFTFLSLSRINHPADCPTCCVCRSGSSRPSRRLTRPSCQCCPPTNASSTTSASHPLPPPSNPPSMWARRAGSLLSHCRSDSLMHPFCACLALGSPVLP